MPPSFLIVVGVVGLVGNLVALLVLQRSTDGHHNLNMKAVMLEVTADALGSLAIIAVALAIALWGWNIADPVLALVFALFILCRAWHILVQACLILLEATPRGLNLAGIREHIVALPLVDSVHDIHASQISTDLPVISAHVVATDEAFADNQIHELLDQLQTCVREHHGVSVEHSTFQIEPVGHRSHESSTCSP